VNQSPLRIVYADLTGFEKITPNDGIMMFVSPTHTDPRLGGPLHSDPSRGDAALREVARALEASFLAEMLKQASFGESRESFGGGAGEDQFASMLRNEHARLLADQGGIGLAESLFQALVARREEAAG
jgi:hypothetical protein